MQPTVYDRRRAELESELAIHQNRKQAIRQRLRDLDARYGEGGDSPPTAAADGAGGAGICDGLRDLVAKLDQAGQKAFDGNHVGPGVMWGYAQHLSALTEELVAMLEPYRQPDPAAGAVGEGGKR